MEDDDATGGNWISVPVTMATTVEDEASQEGSIPVTQVNDEDATRLATMPQSKENDEEEEYWEYELGQKPRKENNEEKDDETEAIGDGEGEEEEEEELEDRY